MKCKHDKDTTWSSSCSVGLDGLLLGLSDSCLQVDWDSSSVLVEARDS